ncbi:ATP synthase subunit C lysine N-methyltransferase-like isoform X2 [Haliotis rufescens]|uniref:ATP synthase subunit C lysine N-methyltransferase-like isoform X2 n=1 Tax=Haliotis rufescens TaxID=6454 RepID=UPI00201F02B4|nr:ATP synthase subunit C lysine N-methyltransferase-like isoform X2 [Haliotis rufescens]
MSEVIENALEQSPKTKRTLTRTGAVILGISGACFVGIYAVAAPFLTPALRKVCLPFVPATTDQVKNVFTVLKGRSGTLIDIGSGDGRIVIEAAKQGFNAYGVELNYWLVLYSRWTAWRHGVSGTAHFFRKDLWKTDLSKYNNVVVFGVEKMMPPLEAKLKTDLCKDGHIVACRFPFHTWEASRTQGTGVDTVWMYKH